MSRFLSVASDALKKLELALAAFSGAALLATMLLIVLDVVMRYYFNQPLTWWYDVLTNYVMIAMFYLAFSLALRRHEHLSIDILRNRIPQAGTAWIFAVVYIVAGPLMLYIGFLGIRSAVASYEHKEVLAGLIAWPTWPSKAIAGVAFLALGLRALLMIADRTAHDPQ